MTKKLVRDKIPQLRPEREYITIDIGDTEKLNKLYSLKIQEELLEVENSNFKDINEFADLIEAVTRLALINGIFSDDLKKAVENKAKNLGHMSNVVLINLREDNESNKIYYNKK